MSHRFLEYLGFEVLTAVKSSIFWDITACGLLKINRGLTAIYHFHLQGQRINKANRWQEQPELEQSYTYHLLSRWFLAWLIFWA
jgi:hypothetical protein